MSRSMTPSNMIPAKNASVAAEYAAFSEKVSPNDVTDLLKISTSDT